jgi:hypothetical protein
VADRIEPSKKSWFGYLSHAAKNWWWSAKRRARRRFGRQTGLGRFADVLGLLTWLYCIWFVVCTFFKLESFWQGALSAQVVGGVLIVTMGLRLLPRSWLISKRWYDDEIRVRYAAATQLVTEALRCGIVTLDSFNLLVECTLQAMTAEMARMFNDSEDV